MEFKTKDIVSLSKATITVGCVTIAAALICSVSAIYIVYKNNLRLIENVYVLDRGRPYRLKLEKNILEDRAAEAKMHLSHALELIFTVTHDPERLKNNFDKLGYLFGDPSGKNFLATLTAKSYYTDMIALSTTQTVYIDSVALKDIDDGFYATVDGRTRTINASTITEHKFKISCNLRSTVRSDNNPEGFLIERFSLNEAYKINAAKRNLDTLN
ncbi:MAG: hypothetical protein ACQPRJ_06320 [Solitalea-like symbiont of Acarus siro]